MNFPNNGPINKGTVEFKFNDNPSLYVNNVSKNPDNWPKNEYNDNPSLYVNNVSKNPDNWPKNEYNDNPSLYINNVSKNPDNWPKNEYNDNLSLYVNNVSNDPNNWPKNGPKGNGEIEISPYDENLINLNKNSNGSKNPSKLGISIFDREKVKELYDSAMKHYPYILPPYTISHIDGKSLLQSFHEEYDDPVYIVGDTLFTKSEYETARKFGSEEFKNAEVKRFKNIFEAEYHIREKIAVVVDKTIFSSYEYAIAYKFGSEEFRNAEKKIFDDKTQAEAYVKSLRAIDGPKDKSSPGIDR